MTVATKAVRAGVECCRSSTAVARSLGNSSPQSFKAILLDLGRRHRKRALKRMLVSLGRRA